MQYNGEETQMQMINALVIGHNTKINLFRGVADLAFPSPW